MEQIPEVWIKADGADVPSEGDVVRVVHGRRAVDAPPRVIQVDRISRVRSTDTKPVLAIGD